MKFRALLVLVLLSSSSAFAEHFETNLDSAKTKAAEQDKNILMVFAGSDWCRPCIKFKRDILLSSEFETYAKENLVVLYLDFPSQKKNKLPADLTAHNERLAEKYNLKGVFPKIIMFNAEESRLGDIIYSNQNPESFVNSCKELTQPPVSESMFPAKKALKLMGCGFEITAIANSEDAAWTAVNAGISEIRRIENLISSWDIKSETSLINTNAGIKPVKVSLELYSLISRSLKVSKLTEGAFDVSFASMEKIYSFDGQEHVLPDSADIIRAKQKVGWSNIILNNKDTSVYLKMEGMRIGFGAIGKGYAANKAVDLMRSLPGVVGGVVNASGDLKAWGENGKSDDWSVQIADPKNKNRALGYLNVKDMSIVTSGNYEKFFTSQGKRYAHILNPKTGYPTMGLKSVTIICLDAEIADALATSVFALGVDKGLHLINSLNGVESILVTDTNELLTSDNLNLNYY